MYGCWVVFFIVVVGRGDDGFHVIITACATLRVLCQKAPPKNATIYNNDITVWTFFLSAIRVLIRVRKCFSGVICGRYDVRYNTRASRVLSYWLGQMLFDLFTLTSQPAGWYVLDVILFEFSLDITKHDHSYRNYYMSRYFASTLRISLYYLYHIL